MISTTSSNQNDQTKNDISDKNYHENNALESRIPKENNIPTSTTVLDDVVAPVQEEKQDDEFSRIKKLVVFIIVLLNLTMRQFSTSGLFPALPSIQQEFSTTETVTNAIIASNIVIGGIAPAIWAVYSDLHAFRNLHCCKIHAIDGRRPIYAVSISIAILGNIGSALAINISMLIAMRAIEAAGSSGCTSVGTGVIVEIFNDSERGRALSWYTAMPIILTIFAPIISGLLTDHLGWRSVFWFYVLCYIALFFGVIFLLPETLSRKRLNRVKDVNQATITLPELPSLSTATATNKARNCCDQLNFGRAMVINPFKSLKLLKYLNLLLTSFYVAISMGTNYATNTSFTWAYSKIYHFDSITVGLCFIAGGVGYCLGAYVAGVLSDRIYQKQIRQAKETGQDIYPEMRLSIPVLGIGVIFMCGGYISYGWCIDKNAHFTSGMISQLFAQFGLMLWVCFLTVYATQCFPGHGTSVQACFQFVKHSIMTVALMTVIDLQNALGYGILYSIIAGVLAVTSNFVFYIKKNKKKWKNQRV